MTSNATSDRWRAADVAALLVRLVLGAILIYMGAAKAADPVEFLKLVRAYDVVHHSLALNLIAAALPWFEVVCGALLLLGVAVRGTALNVAVMLAVFTVLIFLRGQALSASGGLPLCAVRFDCGCGAGEVYVCRKLAENTLLLALSIWLTVRSRACLALRQQILPDKAPASTP